MQQQNLSPFMRFWMALNVAMRERGQSEVLFADARAYWLIAQGQSWQAQGRAA